MYGWRKKPSTTALWADHRTNVTYRWCGGWMASNEGCCSGQANDTVYPHWMGPVHNEGSNIVFTDGHVKWYYRHWTLAGGGGGTIYERDPAKEIWGHSTTPPTRMGYTCPW